jgi:putative Ca2+/H+ antiporter (TMEM165/GDT1 family)
MLGNCHGAWGLQAWRDHRLDPSATERGGSTVVYRRSVWSRLMDAFIVSISTVAFAEMGDRTQILALLLAAHYRRHWPILSGILVATLANHAIAAAVGAWFGRYLTPTILDGLVGLSLLGMAVWTLRPDTLEDATPIGRRGAFVTTLIAFFITEIGDKTQLATVALAAGYANLGAVVTGTTMGMLIANIPVVFLGRRFAERLPIRAIHYWTALLFAALGISFVSRAAAP